MRARATRRLQRRRRLRHRRLRRDRRPQRQRCRRSRGPDPRPRVQQRRRRRPQRLRRRHLGLGLPLRRQRPARHGRVRARHRRGRGLDRAARTAPATSAPARTAAFLPVRVGDSFIADGGRFAAGVLFALDSGADVIQEALGALSNPRAGPAGDRRRVRARRRRGRVDGRRGLEAPEPARVARAHDGGELGHREGGPRRRRRQPGLPRAQRLHELRRPHVRVDPVGQRARRRRPGSRPAWSACSSRRARRRRAAEPGAAPVPRSGTNVLSANEAMQIVRATADDIDFSTPNAVDPANNFGTSTGGLIDTVRYPTDAGLGRDVRLRPHQRLRDGEGGPRRAHPARGRHHRRRAGSTCCPRTAR